MNEKTWFQETDCGMDRFDFCDGNLFGCSFRSPDKETPNEDAAGFLQLAPNHGIVVVADGVGGQNAGDRAARTAVETLLEHCREVPPGERLRPYLLDAIESANRTILGWGIGAGATLIAAEYRDQSVRFIHAGDAGGLLCSNRGNLKFLSVAHAPVAMAVEIGLINETEALEHEDRNLISNCLGYHDMKIEIGPRISMATRDTLLLASDGLFDNLTSDEIVSIIRSGKFEKKAHQLIEKTRMRMELSGASVGKPDDLTVLCFRQ